MKKSFLYLGKQPIANSFLSTLSKKSIKSEYFYNLIGFKDKSEDEAFIAKDTACQPHQRPILKNWIYIQYYPRNENS